MFVNVSVMNKKYRLPIRRVNERCSCGLSHEPFHGVLLEEVGEDPREGTQHRIAALSNKRREKMRSFR